jgi:hypothetical protein
MQRDVGTLGQVRQVAALLGHHRRRPYQPLRHMLVDDHGEIHPPDHRPALQTC